MTDHGDLKAAAAGVQALLVAILTVPSITHLVTKARLLRPNGYGTISGFYEDLDGEATEESTQKYSDLPSRVTAWLSSSLGLAASIVAAVLAHDARSPAGTASSVSGFLSLWADVVAWVSPGSTRS